MELDKIMGQDPITGQFKWVDRSKIDSFPKKQLIANGTQNYFDLETNALVNAVFWNGSILNDSDWNQVENILTLSFTPANGSIIKPI